MISFIPKGLIRQAMQAGAKAAASNATIAGMDSSGIRMLQDQVRGYERDVVNPGIDMLPWKNNSEYPVFQLGTEILGEQVGLLKYMQDNTIQPWIDLVKRGYGELNRRHDTGLISKRDGPRRGGARGRPGQVNKKQEG